MKQKSLAVYFFFGALEALLALILLSSIPSDGKNAFLWGLSPSRLALMIAALGLGIGFYYAGWDALRAAAWTTALSSGLQKRLAERQNLAAAMLGCIWLASGAGFLAYLIKQARFGLWQASFERLFPLILWFCLLCLQSALFLAWNNRRFIHLPFLNGKKTIYILSAGGIVLVLGAAAFVRASGFGIQPDAVAWGAAGTPLLFWQVLASWLGGAGLLWIGLVLPFRLRRGDVISVGLLWLAAFALWGLTPLKPSYFAPPPVPPNMVSYPYSDAALHDTIAQNLLIGEGLGGDGGRVVRRPLYALFLALLHGVAGQDYSRLVILQVAVLAWIPALTYALGASLHSRLAGWMGGLLFILQEYNAISLSGVINVSHSKLLMSDLPAALMLCLFCLLLLRWLRGDGLSMLAPLLAGGALGAAALIRPQALVLFAAAILAAVLCRPGKTSDWLKGIVFLTLGLLLCILPWVWRNWNLTGGFVFDEPSDAQIGMVARRYSLDPRDDEPAGVPATGGADAYSSAMSGQILSFTLQHPAEVLRFTTAHFMHNLVNLAAALPLSGDVLEGEEYVRSQPFWLDPAENPQAQAPFANIPLLLFNLILLGIGLGSALAGEGRQRWVGWIPFFIYLAYNLSNALARNSGWRFLLPGDWVVWTYLAMGMSQLLIWGVGAFQRQEQDPIWLFDSLSSSRDASASRRDWRMVCLGAGLIFLLGASIPLSEALIPQRYVQRPAGQLLAEIRQASHGAQQRAQMGALEALAAEGKVVVLEGRALYPRFYRAGRGITAGSPSPLTTPMDFNRLTFHLAGPRNVDVVLPLHSAPATFPQAADVIVAGCYAEGRLNAFLAASLDGGGFIYEQDIKGPGPCP